MEIRFGGFLVNHVANFKGEESLAGLGLGRKLQRKSLGRWYYLSRHAVRAEEEMSASNAGLRSVCGGWRFGRKMYSGSL